MPRCRSNIAYDTGSLPSIVLLLLSKQKRREKTNMRGTWEEGKSTSVSRTAVLYPSVSTYVQNFTKVSLSRYT